MHVGNMGTLARLLLACACCDVVVGVPFDYDSIDGPYETLASGLDYTAC